MILCVIVKCPNEYNKSKFQIKSEPGRITHVFMNVTGRDLASFLVKGSPVLLDEYGCETYFEWYSRVACKPDAPVDDIKEAPCYLYNDDGKKIDLTPLIKTKGGYPVTWHDGDDKPTFYINVCRGIVPGRTQTST